MKNTFKIGLPYLLAAAAVVIAGCADPLSPTAGGTWPKLSPYTLVTISADALPSRKYTTIGPIQVTRKKPTVFDRNPSQEDANELLSEKAREMGADAVINVTYLRGVDDATSWATMEAKGTAVRLQR